MSHISILRRRVTRLVCTALGVAALPLDGVAQGLMIAPNAIVVDARTRTGAVTLVNPGDHAVEVSLSTLFGIPATDAAGRMELRVLDTVDDTLPSAVGWIRAFPERLILAPGARRTVRLLVQPPAALPTGEYWARLVVASRIVQAASSAETEPASVSVGLTLEVRSVLGVFYRNGAVNTGVTLDSVRALVDGDSLVTRVQMRRTGNAAFVGTLRAELRDSAGVVHAKAALPLGVYYTLDPRIALSTQHVAPGRYSLVVEAVSQRPDVAASLLLPIPRSRLETPLLLPAQGASSQVGEQGAGATSR